MTPKKITLAEFVAEHRKLLDNFEREWAVASAKTKDFPAEMYAGDWDEQFLVYDGEPYEIEEETP